MKLAKKFQEGGPMPAEAAPQEAPMESGAPAAGGSPEDMLMQIALTAMLALQNQDCEAAMAVCQAFVLMIQSQGAAELTEPVYKRGGKLIRRLPRQ